MLKATRCNLPKNPPPNEHRENENENENEKENEKTNAKKLNSESLTANIFAEWRMMTQYLNTNIYKLIA